MAENGVRGYVLKESAAWDIVTAVLEVHAGNVFLSPAIDGFVVPQFYVQGRGQGRRPGVTLTRRETEILKHVGAGLPPREIAAHLNVASGTVRSDLGSIRRRNSTSTAKPSLCASLSTKALPRSERWRRRASAIPGGRRPALPWFAVTVRAGTWVPPWPG